MYTIDSVRLGHRSSIGVVAVQTTMYTIDSVRLGYRSSIGVVAVQFL